MGLKEVPLGTTKFGRHKQFGGTAHGSTIWGTLPLEGANLYCRCIHFILHRILVKQL